MTTLGLAAVLRASARRWWPETVVAFLAGVIFLAFLGSMELWGKREQRASAEALDTVENHHWLVAQIQGRPRLEKPPLPRWTIALLLSLTGQREEWLVRLPGALAGLATTALVYALGSRMGGRKLALVSTLVLCTTGLFIVELRQAGNDGPLALFTTLSLYAAWRSLNGRKPRLADCAEANGRLEGDRVWAILFHGAMGMGFLCKGPIILLLVGLTVVPYLVVTRRLATGARRLADVWGLLLFLALALSWPARVLADDPNVWGVWMTEIGQKTGILPIAHRQRAVLGLELAALAVPWSVMAVAGIALPLVRNRRVKTPCRASSVWFAWWWVAGNLAVFSTWAVAKPNYFVPCLPGLALLVGMAWIRLHRVARAPARSAAATLARLVLGAQWLGFLLVGILAPIFAPRYLPEAPYAWLIVLGGSAVAGIAVGWRIWRSGRDVLALMPVGAACACCLAIGYGMIAPAGNAARGHRRLAGRLEQLISRDVHELRFFHEIDEGLWFYLRAPRLAPVPGSQPVYSDSFDKLAPLLSYELSSGQVPDPSIAIRNREKQLLLDWLRRRGRDEPYLLVRDRLYDRLAPDLSGLALPVYREEGLKRTHLVLLRSLMEGQRIGSSRAQIIDRTIR
jgi:4-amino-4-deoxy-L-arabinose transferase-like glycosyltransferase